VLAPYLDGRRAGTARVSWPELGRAALAYLPHAVVGVALYRFYGQTLYEFQVIGGRGPSAFSGVHLRTLAAFVPLSVGTTVHNILVSAEHSISYLRPNVALPLSRTDIVLAVVTVVVLAAAIALAAWRRKDLLFFVAAFCCWLAPYANVEYIGIWVADRYAYLAAAAVLAVAVRLLLDGVARAGRARGAISVGVAALALVWGSYGILTGRGHQAAFRDARALWSYEAALPAPSILAFNGLGKALLEEAETTSDPVLRRVRLGEIRTVVRAGLLRYQSLPWQPARGYFIAARTEYAGLFDILARAARLAGANPALSLRYLRQSYAIYPSSITALLLAQQLFDQALPDDERLARESLAYCQDFARKTWRDPAKRDAVVALFGNYTRSFPGLAGEIQTFLGQLGR
jgi:hypothetical protein